MRVARSTGHVFKVTFINGGTRHSMSDAQVLNDPRNKVRGTVMVTVSGVLYGLMAYFGMQLIAQHFSVPTMLFWRFFIAALWMFGVGMLSKRKRASLGSNGRYILKLGILSAICYTGCSAFYYASAIHIGTGAAMVLMYAFPIFVVLLAMIFQHWRLNKFSALSLVLVLLGLLMLSGRGDHTLDMLGIVYGISSAISYAVYVYISQESAKKVDSHWLTLLVCLGCSIAFLFLALVTDTFMLPVTMQAWLDIFILAIVATALPIQLLLNGLRYISHIKASILSILEPVVTVIIGMAFLHEQLSQYQLYGVVIILLGAITIQFEDSNEYETLLK